MITIYSKTTDIFDHVCKVDRSYLCTGQISMEKRRKERARKKKGGGKVVSHSSTYTHARTHARTYARSTFSHMR